MHRVAYALILAASSLCVIYAQSTNGSINGRIIDPSQALITDAKFAVISAGTNVRYETTTNSLGQYYLANLPPGAYRIEIESPGFKRLIKPDVLIHVQDSLEINCEMAV